MIALVLFTAISLVKADEDKLVKQLEADFEELVKAEKDPQPIREAARLLDKTNTNDVWTSYLRGLAILRRTRSKAGVPLLLKLMIEHAEIGNAHIIVPEYANTVAILTGKNVSDPYQYIADRKKGVRDEVEKLVSDWWEPAKKKLSTNMGKMSKEQIQVIVHRMMGRTDGNAAQLYRSNPTEFIKRQFDDVLTTIRQERRSWQDEELDAAMVPVLLELAGYNDDPPEKAPEQQMERIPYAVIPILATLRANGLVPLLDKIAADKRQTSVTRITCLLALYRAGEKLNAAEVLAVLKEEKNLERRIVAILSLKFSEDAKRVAAPLMELLDDPNQNIQTAAVYALEGSAPKEALPKLKKFLDELQPRQAVYSIISTIGLMEGKESRAVLADFLEAVEENPKKAQYTFHALMTFQRCTGQNWIEAGAHPESYYREKAKVAVDWWKAQQ
jgi:hypothetical protein